MMKRKNLVGGIGMATDYCNDCNSPMVWCVCKYIDTHINEEHDYSFATDERNYDLCLYCDCRRYNNSKEWVVV